ncbi:MAG: T9SS type A sorting domain-containing protein, partial [Gammaproteobacteria bacterium]|nr:T9SS type A sorting domain-containing protein [Gammaproteobacteria bacterium]
AYPNPVTDRLIINLESEPNSENVYLIDILGKVSLIQAVSKGERIVEVDMAELNSGIYIIRVDMGDSSKLFRVIKH